MPHFIYCGHYYFYDQKLKEIILRKMRKYGLQSSIVTRLYMTRYKLVTKEKVKKAYEGKLENESGWPITGWELCKGSINEDLERFFNNLQNRKELKEEELFSFFTLKLTNEELKLVQEGNDEHLKSYSCYDINGVNPDVDVEEMNKSDSKSKYVHVHCSRITYRLTTESEIEDAKKETT